MGLTALSAQFSSKQTAFQAGEKLTLMLSFRTLGGMLNPDMVEVNISTKDAVVDGVPVYHISGNMKTLWAYRMVYNMNDTYQTWLDKQTLRPVKFENSLSENKYRFVSNYRYDWNAMKVHTFAHNLKRAEGTHRTMDLAQGSYDAFALFYNLRSDDISQYRVGEPRELTFVLEDTIRRIQYTYLGKESKKVNRVGTFNTLKFSCQLATSDGEFFQDGSEFFLWVSDDQNKIPIWIESPIRFGSFVGRISKYSGLKYPLSSKTK